MATSIRDTMGHETLVDRLVSDLCDEIFGGAFAPGDRLPPMRRLAEQYDVTVPTTQRAVARLEEMGLVQARQGSGVRVLDPRRHAALSALPYWVRGVVGQPEEARAVLADFLQLRRDLAVTMLLRGHLELVAGAAGRQTVSERVDTLELAASADPPSLEAIVAADLDVARTLLELSPQVAYATIFNVFEQMLWSLPPLQQAMYAHPMQNVAGYRALLGFFSGAGDRAALRDLLEPMLERLDEATLRRFTERLEQLRDERQQQQGEGEEP